MASVVEMPKLSDTMTVGRLVRWLKNEGDAVKSGDMLAEVETDKATMELENFVDGTLLKQVVGVGVKVPIGAPICVIGKPGEALPEIKAQTATAPIVPSKLPPPPPVVQAKTAQPVVPPAPSISVKSVIVPSEDIHTKASPLAKKIAEDHGLDLRFVKGTGPGGRITKEDVEARIKIGIPVVEHVTTSLPNAPAGGPVATEADIPLTGMRETIAARLLQSKTTVPHFYIEVEVDSAPLGILRAALNKKLEAEGVKLTVNDFILKAVVEAIRAKPAINVSWMGDSIHQYAGVQLSFGVAIDGGLVTPIIRDAHALSLKAISRSAKELTAKARAGKLTPQEMSGSTFTVTNLGMYGTPRFLGIINPPNSAILAVGASRKVPVVDASGNIVAGERMTLTLSCDHRVVDGALAAEFLNALKELLELPGLLLA
jgi:pyruvate dehydrogenase E2 component (dihydrolipoamide acetyltransferase)